ncbi:MAG: AIR synthase family protein [Bacillota bacterium]
MVLKAGKLNINNLKNLILDQISVNNQDILVKPEIGEDSAVIDFGDYVAVMSTDPITGTQDGIGSLAVNVSCNDIAANGAQPIGIQQSLLIPPHLTKDDVIAITQDINQAVQDLEIDILGGHTEVTDAVNKPLISCTAIGKTTKEDFVTSSGAQVGDQIIVTKWTGLEGTSILATDYYNKLLSLGVDQDLLLEAQNLISQISVIPEGLIGAEEKVNAMHDVTEGGLYGSLFELTEAAEVGFKINQADIPLHPATIAITETLNINPYQLIGSGMMILTTDCGEDLAKTLDDSGIKCSIIGEITAEDRIVVTKEQNIELTEAPEDELWNFLANN